MKKRKLLLTCLLIGLGFGPLLGSDSTVYKKISIDTAIEVKQINPNIWQHISYKETEKYGRVPANGLVLVDGKEALIIDTPWNDAQTTILIDWIQQKFKTNKLIVLPTHWHEDCMGGLAAAHKRGAESYAQELTLKLAAEKKLPIPKHSFSESTIIKCGSISIEAYFPGAGHALDNIVAWLPEQKILFAGCITKSIHARGLGFTKDGDLKTWPSSLKKVLNRYPDAKLVFPGHGSAGSLDLLRHTIGLLKKSGYE